MADSAATGSTDSELVRKLREALPKFEDEFVHLARITETAERFEDMCDIMGCLVKQKHAKNENLEVEERNMLSVAYKNVVGQRRASWRTIKASPVDATADGCMNGTDLSQRYQKLVEAELKSKCEEVLGLLQNYLVKGDKDPQLTINDNDSVQDKEAKKATIETQVFYLKMMGDYNRYLAEFSEPETNEDEGNYGDRAKEKYQKALDLAKEVLEPTHPTRLGLALNASVCYYEILKLPTQACNLAKSAFDEAIQKLDSLSDSTYKDSTLIMQLLRDNLTIWTSENDNKGSNVEPRDD